MAEDSILWVRSLLAVYRQAAVDITKEGITPADRQKVIEALGRVHGVFSAHEDLASLWREGFQGSEAEVRTALLPVADAALRCAPDSPIRALVEFAAEEIAALFDGT